MNKEQEAGSNAGGVALVLSGGIALGAYQAGAYAEIEQAGERLPNWLAGISIGAINAAIIAGNPVGQRIEQLHRFWESNFFELPLTAAWCDLPHTMGPWRRLYDQTAIMQTLLWGRPGLFRPRPDAFSLINETPAIYDLAPLREQLLKLIDFDLLNSDAAPRLSIAATDVLTGERVIFDTARGTAIEPEHLLASSALLPLFAPIETAGRLLGDGGLSGNTPIDLVLNEPNDAALICFVVDLFSPFGSRPQSLSAGAARAADLTFGSQTRAMLNEYKRVHRLTAAVQQLAARLPPEVRDDPEIASILADVDIQGGARAAIILLLDYRATVAEAGVGKAFDYASATLRERWQAGACAMREALHVIGATSHDETGAARNTLVIREIEGRG
jgi:NTE family protein